MFISYRRIRRSIASTLICSILLTILPPPSAAESTLTVAPINPLATRATAVSPPNPVRPVLVGKVPALPDSAFVYPKVRMRKFEPFAVVDPSTGKPVSRDATIYLPHQKRYVNAGKYYDDVNRLEQSLNKDGYTLRSHAAPTTCKSAKVYCTAAVFHARLRGGLQSEMLPTVRYRYAVRGRPLIQQNVVDKLAAMHVFVSPGLDIEKYQFPEPEATRLQVVAPKNGATPTPPPHALSLQPTLCTACQNGMRGLPRPKPPKCITKNSMSQAWYNEYWYWATLVPDGIKDKSDKLPPQCRLPRAVKLHNGLINAVKPWGTSMGDPSTAAFSIGTSLRIGGDATGSGIEITANADAKASLLGQGPFSVASANVTSKGRHGSMDLEVLGQTIWNPHGSGKFGDDKTYNVTFFSFQIPINILWFQITLEASGQGTFGLQYKMDLENGSANVYAGPFININGTFSANFGIGIVIVSVSVGIYGNLTIAQFGLDFYASGSTVAQAEYNGKEKKRDNIIGCKLWFTYNLGLDDYFSALSGSMGVQAQACIDLFFWSNCWTAQVPLFNWSGITANDNLFSYPAKSSWTQIGPWYTDRPEYGYPLKKGMAYSPDDRSGEPAVCHALGAK